MRESRLFISYRRDDSAGYARAIAAEMVRRFGAERVFIDVDDIAPGRGFAEAIHQALADASALLVLIGPRWQGEREGQGPRLDEPDDFVRREVSAALTRGLRVIPVLLDGAPPPTADGLPPELKPLASLQAIELGHTRFDADLARLMATLDGILPRSAAGHPRRLRRWALAGAGLAAAVAAGLWLLNAASGDRPAVNGDWRAEVTYGWSDTRHAESFRFSGEGAELSGSAGFLGQPRGVLEGKVDADRLSFVTRTNDMGGAAMVHHYRGRLAGDEIHFVMQTEGGGTAQGPVNFVARRRTATP